MRNIGYLPCYNHLTMAKANKHTPKLFLGFGIITVISGIALAFQEQYVIGIPGALVGVWLIYQNARQLNQRDDK